MFTGIITNRAIVTKIEFKPNKDCLLELDLQQKVERNFDIGCSIACNGICLTLVSKAENILSFEASKETRDVTTLGKWQIGQEINIEFALRLGDEFGGHIVSGHIDGTAKLKDLQKIEDSWKMKFELDQGGENLMKFIAKKGSICVNGVALTVNEAHDGNFEVNIIRHTFENTDLASIKIDDSVNVEVDLLARYVCAS